VPVVPVVPPLSNVSFSVLSLSPFSSSLSVSLSSPKTFPASLALALFVNSVSVPWINFSRLLPPGLVSVRLSVTGRWCLCWRTRAFDRFLSLDIVRRVRGRIGLWSFFFSLRDCCYDSWSFYSCRVFSRLRSRAERNDEERDDDVMMMLSFLIPSYA